jgi:hypothetical protein
MKAAAVLSALVACVAAGPAKFNGSASVHGEYGWVTGGSLVESRMETANPDGKRIQEVA